MPLVSLGKVLRKACHMFGALLLCWLGLTTSVMAQSLPYPVSVQPISTCTEATTIYGELFDAIPPTLWSSSQSNSSPYDLFQATNNIGNDDGTVTDPTIHSLLGGTGVPSPSGGGFIGAFDQNSGEPYWSDSTLGGADWSSADVIRYEIWNFVPDGSASNFDDKGNYFQIVGPSGKLILDLNLSVFLANNIAGDWVEVEALLDTSADWFYT